VKPQRIIKH